ncbi:MAG TPA: transcription termination/antitermination protein NusG [Actinomycetota bacterium]|nr:transcription termination/antitermination protein NusG [Actinomycetota bacterium]
MNESPIDPSDEAVPQPPANADGSDDPETGTDGPRQDDARERLVEAFEEAAAEEAVADAAIEAALEETVEEAIEDAEAVEEASDEAIQDRFEERVEEAAEAGLEGQDLEDAVVQAAADADVQEAIADDAIEAALEETVEEAVADAVSVEEMSDAAIVGELADEVESIAEDVERAESAQADETAGAADVEDAKPAAAEDARPAAGSDGQDPVEEAVETARDPFRSPGDWYVVHTYAGYENKVKTNLESRIHTMQMEDKIFDVHIPMEDVMEIKGGKKQVVQRKVFPGYLLVKMLYDNDSWFVVRNTPGVTGFVAAGTGSKPTPLSRREVEKILSVKKEEVKPQFRLGFEEGDVVRIISGPFADFNGTISEINLDQSKLKVLVNIFDRETPVELSFDQVAKV